jgi:hypothetical protein
VRAKPNFTPEVMSINYLARGCGGEDAKRHEAGKDVEVLVQGAGSPLNSAVAPMLACAFRLPRSPGYIRRRRKSTWRSPCRNRVGEEGETNTMRYTSYYHSRRNQFGKDVVAVEVRQSVGTAND